MNKFLRCKYFIVAALLVVMYGCERTDMTERFGSYDSYVAFVPDYNDASDNANERRGFLNPVQVSLGSGSVAQTVQVAANSAVGTDRTFSVMVDESTSLPADAYTVPSSITIPANSQIGSFDIQFNEDGLDFVSGNLVIMFEATADVNTGPTLTIPAALVCDPENQFVVTVTTDNWPDETSWEITNGSGSVVVSGGPYNNPADDFTTISSDVCLVSGNYTVVLYDSYGDGGSSIEVINNSGTVVASASVSAFEASQAFTVN